MEQSSFFNSVSGDRKYKAENWAAYFSSFIGNGVFATPSTSLFVQANGDMTVTVKAGQAWINGYHYINTADLVLPLSTADGTLGRIDRVVVQWSLTNRAINVVIKKGTPASNPTAPTYQRNADIYELVLADIVIAKGVISVLQKSITDNRWNTTLCGKVAGIVEQIDFSTITAQFNSYMAIMKSQIDADYLEYHTQITEYFEQNKNLIDVDYANYHTQISDYFEDNKNQIDLEYTTFVTEINTYFDECKSRIDLDYESYIEQLNINLNNFIANIANLTSQSELAYNELIMWFSDFKTNATNEFNTWFADVQATLDGDTAGSLLNSINDLKNRTEALENDNTTNKNDIDVLKQKANQHELDIESLQKKSVEFKVTDEEMQVEIEELKQKVNDLTEATTYGTVGYLGNAFLGSTYLANI